MTQVKKISFSFAPAPPLRYIHISIYTNSRGDKIMIAKAVSFVAKSGTGKFR